MGYGTIRIDKIAQETSSAVYKVSTIGVESVDFYICIDKKNQNIRVYLDPYLSNLVYVVDDNTLDNPIKDIPGIDRRALLFSLSKSLKVMRSDGFPDIDCYAA